MSKLSWVPLVACIALTGCSSAPVVLNYAPSSTMSIKGAQKVGEFDYLPAKNGKIKPNQIRNTAIGNAEFDKNVEQIFHQALFTESRFVGITTDADKPLLHGSINDFLIDDLGFSIDWTLDVTYIVDAPEGDKPCYSQSKTVNKHTAKFVNPFGTLNEVMKLNIEEVFKDPAFVACIAPAKA
ncbi:hypothetical protein [Dyella sp. 2RAB6]|uniref:hypothetical protein n=1 Tax=Dyella sp. 2RAB6 TaxID=3232992 RepID=UPI003F8F786F